MILKTSISPLDGISIVVFRSLFLKVNKYTHGPRSLTTLLVKYYNGLLDAQSSERSRDEVTFFYVGDILCIHLGCKYADFQEKIFADISGKKFQTFHCSNVTIYNGKS